MPADWGMEDTHSDLFQLAHHLLVEPWDKSAMKNWNPSRKPGWRPGLAFSGGIDSAAAMALMPEETVLLYNERSGISGQLDHTNAFRFFEKITEDTDALVHKIRSNHEQLRALKVRLLDFQRLCVRFKSFYLRTILDLTALQPVCHLKTLTCFGHKFRDFSTSWFWKHYSPMFDQVGLSLYQPLLVARKL